MNNPLSTKLTLLASAARADTEQFGPRDLPARKLRVSEAAEFCGCSVSKLNKHRVTGDGADFIKCGRLVMYDIRDLEAWLAQSKRRSTSEQP
jgi:hypothetical protein